MPLAAMDVVWKLWYPLLTRLTRRSPIVFLNYGYADPDRAESAPELSADDEADRTCIQLYHNVVGSADLKGLRVLEVSSGHGGGASYIARYFEPELMHGVDRNPAAVKLCQRLHRVRNLAFSCGNALALDFENESFDAVVNVEASHCYPDLSKFLSEVVRVLRPGGHFYYADFRDRDPGSSMLDQQLRECGLEVISREDISANVVSGIALNTPKYMAQIDRLVPTWLKRPAMRFAGVVGSPVHTELISGQTVYLRYVLRKSPTVA